MLFHIKIGTLEIKLEGEIWLYIFVVQAAGNM